MHHNLCFDSSFSLWRNGQRLPFSFWKNGQRLCATKWNVICIWTSQIQSLPLSH